MAAKYSDVKVGTILITDRGFTYMKEGERKQVFAGENGMLYVQCKNDGTLAGSDFEQ